MRPGPQQGLQSHDGPHEKVGFEVPPQTPVQLFAPHVVVEPLQPRSTPHLNVQGPSLQMSFAPPQTSFTAQSRLHEPS